LMSDLAVQHRPQPTDIVAIGAQPKEIYLKGGRWRGPGTRVASAVGRYWFFS
jgi:hypothetical protein